MMTYTGRGTTDYAEAIVTALAALGITGEISPTGGNCWAVIVQCYDGRDEIIVTNGDADLPDDEGALVILCLMDGGDFVIGDVEGVDPVAVADMIKATDFC